MHIFIPGHPRPKGSLRHIGKGRLIEQTDVKHWMNQIRTNTNHPTQYNGPLALDLNFIFPRPKTVTRTYPHVRSVGDIDKLCRAVLDALQTNKKQGTQGLYDDDAQVVTLTASKEYGDEPGVHITLTPLSGNDAQEN